MTRGERACAVVSLALAVSLMTGCESSPTKRTSADLSKVEVAQTEPRFIGFKQTVSLDERIRLFRTFLTEEPSLDSLHKRFKVTRFPSETLGGEVAYVGFERNNAGAHVYVLYDNGIELTEDWTVHEDPRSGAKATAVPGPGGTIPDPPEGEIQDWLLDVDGTQGVGHQKARKASGHAPYANPSNLEWNREGVRYTLVSFEARLEDLAGIAESMR